MTSEHIFPRLLVVTLFLTIGGCSGGGAGSSGSAGAMGAAGGTGGSSGAGAGGQGGSGSAGTNGAGGSGVGNFTACKTYTIPTQNADPEGVAIGPDGNVWFTEVSTLKIGHTIPSGTSVEFVLPTVGSRPSRPTSIVAGPDGNIWFTEVGDSTAATVGKIGRMTPNGALTEFPLANPEQYGPIPTNMIVGQDGNLWFFLSDGLSARTGIGRVDPNGTITEFPLTGTLKGANVTSLTKASDGSMWFGAAVPGPTGTASRLGRITTAGEITAYSLTTPVGLGSATLGPDGNLWVLSSVDMISDAGVDQIDDSIARIGITSPPGPLAVTQFVLGPSIPSFGVATTSGIALGPDHNVWFTGPEFGNISATGDIQRNGGGFGAITAGPDGNMWAVSGPGVFPIVSCIRPSTLDKMPTDGGMDASAGTPGGGSGGAGGAGR